MFKRDIVDTSFHASRVFSHNMTKHPEFPNSWGESRKGVQTEDALSMFKKNKLSMAEYLCDYLRLNAATGSTSQCGLSV